MDLPPLCKGVAVARAGLLPMWLFCLVLLMQSSTFTSYKNIINMTAGL